MKQVYRKTITAVAAVLIPFVLASCSEKENNDSIEDQPSVSVTESVTETDENDVTETDSDNDGFDISTLKYDFSGLDSEEYIQIFADAHYTLKASITQDQIELSQVMYVDAPNKKILFNYKNPAYSMSTFITEGKMYYIAQDKYFVMDMGEYGEDIISAYAIYKKCGYIGSGSKELGGVSYKYDEYYDLEQKRSFMILMNNSNELEGILDAGMFTRVNSLEKEFDDSAFNILDGLTEITQQEFGELMNSLTAYNGEDDSN